MAYAHGILAPVSVMTVEEKAKVLDDIVVDFKASGKLAQLFCHPLVLAAYDSDADRTRKLLELGASANTTFCSGESVLHSFAVSGNRTAVQALLERGATVDALDPDGNTALQRAALCNESIPAAHGGSAGVITTLLRYRASVDNANLDGATALHHAALAGKVDAINALVEAGADIHKKDLSGRTPLHVASEHNVPASVTALCRHGAEKNEPDMVGDTPLMYAVMDSCVGAVEALLDAGGVDVNVRRSAPAESPLDVAARMGNVDLARLLLNGGANANAVDWEHRTALHKAAFWNKDGVIEVLIGEGGANVHARGSWSQRTPLHDASGNMAMGAVYSLLRHGANVNAPDKLGQSPLHRAVRVSQQDSSVAVVEYLLLCDADETAVDCDGRAPAEVVHQDVLLGLRPVNGALPHAASNPSVLGLLARAPAERAWRRRGLVVKCRARLIKEQEQRNLNLPERDAEEASRPTKFARVGGGGGDDGAAGHFGSRGIAHRGAAEGASSVAEGDAEGLVARVVGISVEGVFRNMMKFL